VPSAELGADANQAGARLHARLASEACGAVATQDIEQLFFLLFRGREQPFTLEDFDVAGAAARGATRERDGRERLVANIDELTAVFDVDGLCGPNIIGQELDLRHARPIPKTRRSFNGETRCRRPAPASGHNMPTNPGT
jgi:hypothetical protein